MKWVKVFCLSLIVSVGVVKMTWAAEPKLSDLGCSSQADSFGMALVIKTFAGVFGKPFPKPGADGFFSYGVMGVVYNWVYRLEETSELVEEIKRQCREQGKESVISEFEAASGLTYVEREQVWDSYQRTPREYLEKYYQTPLGIRR